MLLCPLPRIFGGGGGGLPRFLCLCSTLQGTQMRWTLIHVSSEVEYWRLCGTINQFQSGLWAGTEFNLTMIMDTKADCDS